MTETLLEKPAEADNIKTIEYYKYIAEVVIPGTRGARFTAARLLVLKERASLFIQSLLAILLVCVSIILLTSPDNVDPNFNRQIGIVSTISSVAILAITLFEYALGRGLLAATLHDSSLRVTAIMRKLERELAKPAPSIERLEKWAVQYEEENIYTNVNHSAVDFTLHKISRAKSRWFLINLFLRLLSMIAQAFVVAFAVLPGLLILGAVLYQSRGLFVLLMPMGTREGECCAVNLMDAFTRLGC
jgi:hypothetical protein